MAFHSREPLPNDLPAAAASDDLDWALPVEDEPRQALPLAEPYPSRPRPVADSWDDPYELEPLAEPVRERHYEVEFDDYDERPRRRRRPRRRKPSEPNRLIPLFIGYGMMLGLLVATVVVAAVILLSQAIVNPQTIENWTSAAFEAICTVLVFVVALSIGRIRPHRTNGTLQVAAWCAGFPVLGVLLVVNICFVTAVRELFKVPHEPGPGITLVTFLLICLQPALVEEWFFRHLALGTLRKPLGLHGAVWISGAMFGFAHLLNPIAMPYLVVLGVCLGYLRVWSGGLILPMLLHGVHNAVVLLADHAM